jgi:dihydrofolate synthase/folylpolyglutamate synthase
VHVAGTNGKGSTCVFLRAILKAAGQPGVGMYISPHLERDNERISIDGTDISDEDFAELSRQVLDAWHSIFADEPIYFNLLTAVMFLYFKQRNVSTAILEVGLGGRTDQTNVITNPLCSVIAQIGLDHTAFLGGTAELIAAEKAGIIKPNCPVVFAAQSPEVERVFIERAEALNAPYYRAEPLPPGTPLSLRGAYQFANAGLAAKAAELLGIGQSAIAEGLQSAVWRGRFEVFELAERNVTVVLDGGHNPNGAEALARSLAAEFPGQKFTFLFNAREDKDRAGMLAAVAPLAKLVIRVNAGELINALEMLLDEFAESGEHQIVCIFGTLYQVNDVLKYFDN